MNNWMPWMDAVIIVLLTSITLPLFIMWGSRIDNK
jgi:hypothetical protein